VSCPCISSTTSIWSAPPTPSALTLDLICVAGTKRADSGSRQAPTPRSPFSSPLILIDPELIMLQFIFQCFVTTSIRYCNEVEVLVHFRYSLNIQWFINILVNYCNAVLASLQTYSSVLVGYIKWAASCCSVLVITAALVHENFIPSLWVKCT
jgi:hypothetical protein